MTLYQFNVLEEKEKYEMLWDEGVVIANRQTDENKFLLYQLDGFYAELTYNPEMNKIINLRTFTNTNQLEPYLNNMKIPEMF